MYFYGTYEHTIDDRGRIAVPARFRRALADGAIVRSGQDGCTEMYTHEGFEQEVRLRLGEATGTRRRAARLTRRSFLAGAFEVELDTQGRIVIPPPVREQSEFAGRAVFVGCGDYIELWSPERWAGELDAIERAERDAAEDDTDGDGPAAHGAKTPDTAIGGAS